MTNNLFVANGGNGIDANPGVLCCSGPFLNATIAGNVMANNTGSGIAAAPNGAAVDPTACRTP